MGFERRGIPSCWRNGQNSHRNRGIHDFIGDDIGHEHDALGLVNLASRIFADRFHLGWQAKPPTHHFVIVNAKKHHTNKWEKQYMEQIEAQ